MFLYASLFALMLLLVVVGLLLMPGFTPSIKPKSGAAAGRQLAVLEKVSIGGAEQWILVRTEDVQNPIILFLHGGPGTSQLTLMRRNTRDVEQHFTVVNWDQRGAGKSYAAIADTGKMNIEQFVDETIELTKYLLHRFGKEKIVLVGHSWGSAVGALAVQRAPELYHSYIGIGQISDMAQSERVSYEWTLAQAVAAGDKSAVQKLRSFGAPPYTEDWRIKFLYQRKILARYGGELHGSSNGALAVVLWNLLWSTEYTVLDRVNFFRGILGSLRLLFPELLTVNLFQQVPEMGVPVYFTLGRHDYEVPAILSERYFDALKAPRKELVWFEHSAHLPNTEEREKFNAFLVERVLPTISE